VTAAEHDRHWRGPSRAIGLRALGEGLVIVLQADPLKETIPWSPPPGCATRTTVPQRHGPDTHAAGNSPCRGRRSSGWKIAPARAATLQRPPRPARPPRPGGGAEAAVASLADV